MSPRRPPRPVVHAIVVAPETARERTWYRPGAVVYVKGFRSEGPRRVVGVLPEIPGARVLDLSVGGARCWNIRDLVKVRCGPL